MQGSLPPSANHFLAFTARSTPPRKQLVLRSAAQVRQAASLGKGGDPQSFMAIWDTGASATCISPKISQALGLGAISMATIQAVGSSHDVSICKIDVILPNGLTVADVRAAEVGNIQGADMLIGMDIITTGDLAITNAFSFRFPPASSHIDYAGEGNRISQRQQQSHDRQKLVKNLRRKGKLR
jgi:hypothetical protein